eukprot:7213838-Prymnesium_polylepis.1
MLGDWGGGEGGGGADRAAHSGVEHLHADEQRLRVLRCAVGVSGGGCAVEGSGVAALTWRGASPCRRARRARRPTRSPCPWLHGRRRTPWGSPRWRPPP